MTFRSPKLLQSAEGQRCASCGDQRGTTVAAHLNSVEHGKGTGIKCPDFMTADLCDVCHALYDGRMGKLTKAEKVDLWMTAYLRTVKRWFTDGTVVVK